MKEKIKFFFKWLIMPLLIYVGITCFVYVIGLMLGVLDESVSADGKLLIIQGVANIITIAIYIPLYLAFIKHQNENVINLTFSNWFYLIPLSFSVCIFGNLFLSLFFDISKNPVSEEISLMIEKGNIIFILFLVVILAPIIEEILFRGFIYGAIKKICNEYVAIIISAILFGIIHGNFIQGIYAVFAGLALGYIRYKYNRLLPTIIMHLLMNFFAIIMSVSLIEYDDLNSKLFVLFIATAILVISIFRLNYNKNI